jgi:anti-anti-sigma factor
MWARPHWVTSDTATVQLKGEIDASNAERVAGFADDLDGATVIILDMGGVSFLGAAGLTALLQLATRLSLAGGHLVLTGTDHHPVRRPIAICGLDSILDCRSIMTERSEKITEVISSQWVGSYSFGYPGEDRRENRSPTKRRSGEPCPYRIQPYPRAVE